MPVSKEQVLATARLCRLDVSVGSAHAAADEDAETRVTRVAAELDAILGYMDILDQVDTHDVEPLYSPMQHTAPPRPDRAEQRREAGEILANAPKRQGNFFAVPPVIG